MVLAILVALPLLGTSAAASAKAKAAAGCHKTHTCKSGGGPPTGSGTGGAPAPLTVQIDPNPLVETGQSDVYAVIQVETSPAFAGDPVRIDSSQLTAACGGTVAFSSVQPGQFDDIQVVLDDDGNATVVVEGTDCAPGPSLIEADLTVAPYDTALGTLVAQPPVVTPTGVTGYPTTSGSVTKGEVETGDTNASGDSDVYAVFYVETSPFYAEQTVEIESPQLQDRCLTFWAWQPGNGGGANGDSGGGGPITTTLDDDGNAVFIFDGISCAAGESVVTADVLAGTHPTYTTTFNIVAPQPTI